MKFPTPRTMRDLIICVAVLLCTWGLAQPMLAHAQTTYTYPGVGALVNQDGTPVNTKRYTTAAECETDAWAENLRRKTVSPALVVSAVECVWKKGFVTTWPAPPVVPPVIQPPVTTSGLGRLPANPVINVGYATERLALTGAKPDESADGTGDFRTRCVQSHFAFDDPLVFPGQPGKSHLHAFMGNTATNAYSTDASIRTTGNSTCRGGIANRSSYWVPAMIDTATGDAIPFDESDVYYKSAYRGILPADIRPIPDGLRMIAGDSKSFSPPDPYNSIYAFVCHNTGLNRGPTIPDCPVGDYLEMSIAFPQCMLISGEVDSPDHKSHMAYGTGKGCPPTHPVAIPEVSFHILYPITRAGQTRTWRLSSDTYTGPAGYTAHADFWFGWKRDVADAWARGCVAAGKDCHSTVVSDGREIY